MSVLTEKFSNLNSVLLTQAEKILAIVSAEPGSDESPFILLPEPSHADEDPSEIARYVAITSNEYAKATRLAGICRALMKTTEGHYKHKYKVNLGQAAKNQAEREANAHAQTEDEYNTFVLMSSLVELAESWEAATRIASESARRMLLTTENMRTADRRGSVLPHTESGFKPY